MIGNASLNIESDFISLSSELVKSDYRRNGKSLKDGVGGSLTQIYMAMGGVPHYLAQIKSTKSVAQNMNDICFKETGILFSEFDKLFKSLFENAKYYIELIRIISSIREGVSRRFIEEKSKLSTKGGMLSDRLKDLELAGFIKEFLPMGHQRQGVYYRIIDEYCYFYLKWIEPARRTLITLEYSHAYWLSKLNTPEYFSWMGYAFESVCYKHLTQIKNSLNVPVKNIGTWRYTPRKDSFSDQGTQIDLIFERADDAITLCEIKCTDKPFLVTKEYYEKLITKVEIYKKVTHSTRQIFMIIISANGVKENTYSKKLINQVLTLEELYK